MSAISKQYIHNIRWSIIEAVIFQGLLFFHQYMLFKVTDSSFYGITGSIFGIAYFLIKFFDFGLNKSFISFYEYYSASKQSFDCFIKAHVIPTIGFYVLTCIFVFFTKTQFINTLFPNSCDTNLLLIIMIFIATESIKSYAKKILQLSHHFRQVALGEIAFILCYQGIIWSYYWNVGSFAVPFIIGSCAATSFCEMTGLIYLVWRWRISLPHNCRPLSYVPYTIIIKNRLFAFGHAMGKQSFSANMLVPLFAYLFGFESAALLKLVSYFTHSVTTIIERIVDPTSSALFAHIKNECTKTKQEFFCLALQLSYHLVICLFIFCAINFTKILHISTVSYSILLSLVLYFFIHYSENLFIIIERFYVAHGKSEFLLITTFFNTILATTLLLYSLSPLVALILVLCFRVLSFFILLFYLSYLWGIYHRVNINKHYIAGALALSLLFFIIF